MRRIALTTMLVALTLVASGCRRTLGPAPNVFTQGHRELFIDVHPDNRTTTADVLFVTDRMPTQKQGTGRPTYGHKRSYSLAYGSAIVQIGYDDVTWDELAADTTLPKSKRKRPHPLKIKSVTELGRFPRTPPDFEVVDGRAVIDPGHADEMEAAEAEFRAEISRRLALTPLKKVFISVHGFHNKFETTLLNTAEFWHLSGRRGLIINYSWPAGSPGLLKAYNYDRESSEFTVFHLKQLIRTLAECPDVEEIAIGAHSRGTDVAVTALRELMIEARGGGTRVRDRYRIGNVVLLAPDIDYEVLTHRSGSEYLFIAAKRWTIYVSDRDEALGWATRIFGSLRRAGQIGYEDLGDEEKRALSRQTVLAVVDASNVSGGGFGHGYYADPAVSSDLIFVSQDDRDPGAANGRPLTEHAPSYWFIDKDYPGEDWTDPGE